MAYNSKETDDDETIYSRNFQALEAMDEDSGDVIEMKKLISQKNDEIKKLQESYEQLQNEYEKRCSAEAEKRVEFSNIFCWKII